MNPCALNQLEVYLRHLFNFPFNISILGFELQSAAADIKSCALNQLSYLAIYLISSYFNFGILKLPVAAADINPAALNQLSTSPIYLIFFNIFNFGMNSRPPRRILIRATNTELYLAIYLNFTSIFHYWIEPRPAAADI